jgi:2'-5' RNA ligase
MVTTKGYSLWLMPSGKTYDKLSNLISGLSKRFSTPVFEPHVTLIGEVEEPKEEVISKTRQLAKTIQPYVIKLTKAGYLDEYFRCIFIHAEESEDVVRANYLARKIFNRPNDPRYMPHLSLMYGEFTESIKHKIIAEIDKDIYLNFEAKSIFLYSTKGEVKDWTKTEEFPFE